MVKVGIIGTGFGLYGLLPAFNQTTGCKVTSICGKKTLRLVSYCQKIGLEKIYTDWQEMLDKEDLDAVVLAVVPSAQYKIAKIAIKRGLHVFAEKPLAATLKQAQELFSLAKKKKIIHAIDFIFPEIEEWKKVKEVLDKKTYGKLKQIDLNWDFLSYDVKNKKSSWKTDVAKGGGALSFYFSHSLYYLEYFAGKILSSKGKLSYSKESINGGEVGVDLILKFENNVIGKAHFNCNNKKLNRHQLIFIFENGTIVLENKNSITSNFIIKIYTQDRVRKLPRVKEKKLIEDEDERVRVVKKLAARFVNACLHNKQVTPSFKEGVRVQELIEKIRAENE